MDCPNCGNETGKRAAFCTRCGVSRPRRPGRAKSIFKWGGIGCGGLLGLLTLLVIAGTLTTDTPSSDERETPDRRPSPSTPSPATQTATGALPRDSASGATHTPTAGHLSTAYSTALDALYIAQDDLQDARARILGHLQVVPDIALAAVQEALGCDVPIDDLINDPRDALTSVFGNLSDSQLAAARDAPRSVAQDLAAAHVASLADRDAIDAARRAHTRSQLLDLPTPDNPAFETYLAYLREGDDSAFDGYLSALDEINDAYFPVDERLNVASRNLVSALIQLPGKASPADCARTLSGLYEAYMMAFEVYRPALGAYLDGISTAIHQYARALESARASYADR